MKDLETCFEYLNKRHCPPHIAEEIFKRNIHMSNIPKIGEFRFIAGAQIFKNSVYHGHGKYPGQLGDCGIYWTTKKGKVIGMASFNLDVQEDKISVVQIQGTKINQLNNFEKKYLRILPWEQSLLDVIETSATWCNAKELWVTSCTRIPKVQNGYLNDKNLSIRYDVAAIERGFYQAETPGWYKKILR